MFVFPWTGGHLVPDLGVQPRALMEETFEPLSLSVLAIKVVTGGVDGLE